MTMWLVSRLGFVRPLVGPTWGLVPGSLGHSSERRILGAWFQVLFVPGLVDELSPLDWAWVISLTS